MRDRLSHCMERDGGTAIGVRESLTMELRRDMLVKKKNAYGGTPRALA
ncbi:MAG: hypothetical protein NTY51_06950 [Deltaproteobacteria bacterium]|nr:hypothetical protein [Deltaproteobacteria bacterium]